MFKNQVEPLKYSKSIVYNQAKLEKVKAGTSILKPTFLK